MILGQLFISVYLSIYVIFRIINVKNLKLLVCVVCIYFFRVPSVYTNRVGMKMSDIMLNYRLSLIEICEFN